MFESFEECFNFVNRPTNYELKHGITVFRKHCFLDAGDFKVYVFYKSDSTKTIVLFFKNSKTLDVWKFWVPSENQLNLLAVLPHITQVIEAKNAKVLAQVALAENKKLYGFVGRD